MVAVPEVQIGEDLGLLKELKSRVHERQLVPVLDGDVVKPLVVDAGPQGLVLLLHKEKTRPLPAKKTDG